MMLQQVWFFFVSQVIAWAALMLLLAELDQHPNQIVLSVVCFAFGLMTFLVLRKRFVVAPIWARALVLILTVIGIAAIPMAASSLFR